MSRFAHFQPLRKMGLEPTRPNGHKILSLARLPVPTLPLTFTTQIIFYYCMSKKSIPFCIFMAEFFWPKRKVKFHFQGVQVEFSFAAAST